MHFFLWSIAVFNELRSLKIVFKTEVLNLLAHIKKMEIHILSIKSYITHHNRNKVWQNQNSSIEDMGLPQTMFNSWNFGLHDMESYFCTNIDYDGKKMSRMVILHENVLFYY